MPTPGADHLGIGEDRVNALQAGARVAQDGIELADRCLRFVHHALFAKDPLVGLGQQGVGAVQRGDDLAGVVIAAEHTTKYAVTSIQALSGGAQVAQAGIEAGIGGGHVAQVGQQVARGSHQLRELGGGVTAQHGALRSRGQGWVAHDAGVGAQAGVADDAALHGEHAGTA